MLTKDAAIAANRFGLGARPGDARAIGSDARGWLEKQLEQPAYSPPVAPPESARVLAEVPDATLVMVGRGDDVDRLRTKAAALGIGRSVHFPGFLSDAALRAVLRHTAVLAMPSRGEGFGLVYLQAMQLGVPCLGSRDDAAGDVIVDGETGLLVPHQDPDAIAGAIARLLTDEPMRRRMGEADADAVGQRQLTERQLEILRLIARGMSNREIAATLFVSEHTVHRHVANILQRLDVSSRAAAAAYATSHNLI